MKTVWQSHERFVFAALVGVALWLVNFAQAHVLTLVNPALPAVLAGFTTPFFLAVSYIVTKRRFAITTTYVVFAGVASFNMVMGPPGVHKLLLALLSAGAYDIALILFPGTKNWRMFPAFAIYTAVSLATYVGAFVVLNLPGKDKLLTGLAAFAVIFFVEGLISTGVAILFYRKWLLTLETVRKWAES